MLMGRLICVSLNYAPFAADYLGLASDPVERPIAGASPRDVLREGKKGGEGFPAFVSCCCVYTWRSWLAGVGVFVLARAANGSQRLASSAYFLSFL